MTLPDVPIRADARDAARRRALAVYARSHPKRIWWRLELSAAGLTAAAYVLWTVSAVVGR